MPTQPNMRYERTDSEVTLNNDIDTRNKRVVRVSAFLAWVVLGAIILAVLAVLYWDDQRYLKDEPVGVVEEDEGVGVPLVPEMIVEVGLWFLAGL